MKPVKKSSKPSKEKMALGATAPSAKVLPKERKPKLVTGSEKSTRESVASDPTVKAKVRDCFTIKYKLDHTWANTTVFQCQHAVLYIRDSSIVMES